VQVKDIETATVDVELDPVVVANNSRREPTKMTVLVTNAIVCTNQENVQHTTRHAISVIVEAISRERFEAGIRKLCAKFKEIKKNRIFLEP